MARRSGVSSKISTVIVVLFSLTFSKGDITRVSAMVGEEKQLHFSYPCDSTRVTLRNGIWAPFYDSTNPDSLSLPENKKLAFRIKNESNICLLQLKIYPVLRSDEGGYILTAYAGDGNILEDTRVGLRVDYPPGKASCGWEEETVADDWRLLECTAWFVSLLGEIVCYQNEIRVPPVRKPRDRDGILEHTMWVRFSQPAFCCALLVGQPVDRCKCNDYTWAGFSNLTEPCPVAVVTTHQGASTSSQSPTSIPTKEATQKAKKNHWSNVVTHVIYLFVIGILIIIIGICLVLSIREACKVEKISK
ncbi:uncharacterized protein LOC115922717 [Strongylocentrotus purpuratus]|uniref:Uncharacterized protein n=1 Tax=Strongylocentrotus purpuratus TaxID=7668 RepID=A0A7M7NMP3_STRPU|nr:uncharacterized protein LOC115922717 [Strongylocentrotus purpuratus]XP_030838027.1 uncharacterized protein LOC115922717 [Strongylocentrotus purpuratus]